MTTESTDRADAAAEAAAWEWASPLVMGDASTTASVVKLVSVNGFMAGALWGQQRERERMVGLLVAVDVLNDTLNAAGNLPISSLYGAANLVVLAARAALAEGEGRADDH